MLETELITGHGTKTQPTVAKTGPGSSLGKNSLGKSRLVNRNVNATHGRTSMRLEPEVWDAIREICLRDDIDLGEMIKRVEKNEPVGGRTSAVRVYVLQYFRDAASEDGHRRAGHGPRDELSRYSHVHGAALRVPE